MSPEIEARPPGTKTEFDPADPALPGRVAAWLESAWNAPVRISAWKRFYGGLSWVTIGFTATVEDADRQLILRLGDPAGLFSPYRTEPEYLALKCLQAVPGLPIPRPVLRCDDLGVVGAPFVVTERVPGDAPGPWSGESMWTEGERASLAAEFSETLGKVHAFDWRDTPLASWAQGINLENTAVVQTRSWARHCGHPHTPLPPAMHHAMRWLEAHAPQAQRIVLVHGDYRVGNFLRQGGRITAILDWEMVHLGDAHEDLAWAALRAFSPPRASRVGGLVDREEFHRRYKEASGLEVDPAKLRYYAVLGEFKSAAILLGAMRRMQSGLGRDVRMASMGLQLAPTLAEMLRVMEVDA